MVQIMSLHIPESGENLFDIGFGYQQYLDSTPGELTPKITMDEQCVVESCRSELQFRKFLPGAYFIEACGGFIIKNTALSHEVQAGEDVFDELRKNVLKGNFEDVSLMKISDDGKRFRRFLCCVIEAADFIGGDDADRFSAPLPETAAVNIPLNYINGIINR